MAKQFKLNEIQETLEELIVFISETYSEHKKASMIIHNLRGAADGIHEVRFDAADKLKIDNEQN